jgi:hypothetical protein
MLNQVSTTITAVFFPASRYNGRAWLNPGTCREPWLSASPFSQVIDKLGHGSGIDGGGAVELLH